jgi:hypothetical protein
MADGTSHSADLVIGSDGIHVKILHPLSQDILNRQQSVNIEKDSCTRRACHNSFEVERISFHGRYQRVTCRSGDKGVVGVQQKHLERGSSPGNEMVSGLV